MEFELDCFKCGGDGKIMEKLTCNVCGGRGSDPKPDALGGGAFFNCLACGGHGFTYVEKECPLCDGTGKTGGKKDKR